MKQVKKKQKHKSKGSIRTITKQVKADSFFNFFDPPIVPDDPNAEVDEDTQVVLQIIRSDLKVTVISRPSSLSTSRLATTSGRELFPEPSSFSPVRLWMTRVITTRRTRTRMMMTRMAAEVKMMPTSTRRKPRLTQSVNNNKHFLQREISVSLTSCVFSAFFGCCT